MHVPTKLSWQQREKYAVTRLSVRSARRARYPYAEAVTVLWLSHVMLWGSGSTHYFSYLGSMGFLRGPSGALSLKLFDSVGSSAFGSVDRAYAAADRVYRELSAEDRMNVMRGINPGAA